MLTVGELKTYFYVRHYIFQYHRSPTMQQIAKGLELASRSGAHRHIKSLVDKGYIKMKKNSKRNISLTDKIPEYYSSLPLLGNLLTNQCKIQFLSYYSSFQYDQWFENKNYFVVKIYGDGLMQLHICDGDYLFCQLSLNFLPNDLVIIADEHNFYFGTIVAFVDQQRICFESFTQAGQQIDFELEKIKLSGIYRGVIRLYET